jgi:hypothetical protein
MRARAIGDVLHVKQVEEMHPMRSFRERGLVFSTARRNAFGRAREAAESVPETLLRLLRLAGEDRHDVHRLLLFEERCARQRRVVGMWSENQKWMR